MARDFAAAAGPRDGEARWPHGTVGVKALLRMPTSALLERVEQHINRLDQALKETEAVLHAVRSGDRDDWIRQLQERLAAAAKPETCGSDIVLAQPRKA